MTDKTVKVLCFPNSTAVCIIRVIYYPGSLELISKVALHVNESMRQVDNFKKLMEVQKKLIGDGGDNLISPSRVSVMFVACY